MAELRPLSYLKMNESDISEQKQWFDNILHLDDDGNTIPATPVQTNFIETYSQFLNSILTPQTAAEKVQRLVKSLSD